jgi:hypothetical protein
MGGHGLAGQPRRGLVFGEELLELGAHGSEARPAFGWPPRLRARGRPKPLVPVVSATNVPR